MEKKISIVFAVCGLLIMVIGYRQIPLIAVSLGLTFAVYAAIKKSVDLDPLQSLLYETICIAPIALAFVIYFESTGTGALSVGGSKFVLSLFCGCCYSCSHGTVFLRDKQASFGDSGAYRIHIAVNFSDSGYFYVQRTL